MGVVRATVPRRVACDTVRDALFDRTGLPSLVADLMSQWTDDGSISSLHAAAEMGNAPAALRILEQCGGDLVDERDCSGATPLEIAAKNGHSAVIPVLLKAGAYPNSRNSQGNAPLHEAVAQARITCCRLLLDGGADASIKGKNAISPLHEAARGGLGTIARLLLAKGAFINAQDVCGRTPLHVAVESRQRALALLLLARGADPCLPDVDGTTPLHLAALFNMADVAQDLMAHKADINAQDKDGRVPLMEAATRGHLHVMEGLLRHPWINADISDDNNMTALMMACQGGHLACVDLLLSNKSCVHRVGRKRRSSVHLAAENGFASVVSRLVDAGASPSAPDKDGRTPLHIAAAEGHLDVVVDLLTPKRTGVTSLEPTVDVDARDANGFTPLMAALLAAETQAHPQPESEASCGSEGSSHSNSSDGNKLQALVQIIRILVLKGAQVDIDDGERNALEIAQAIGEPVAGLIAGKVEGWNLHNHSLFPPKFQEAVSLLLLANYSDYNRSPGSSKISCVPLYCLEHIIGDMAKPPLTVWK
eukprot:jgi/Mesvir1/13424/Mv16502-RA.1